MESRGEAPIKSIMLLQLLLLMGVSALPDQGADETTDGQISRKVLGSSVVTSVSIIMDNGNGSQAYFSDAVGKPMVKPPMGTQLASPINLLNPDRYEFYTFDDSGDLVKRLMTIDEIQGIIANGDSELLSYNPQSNNVPEKKVNDVVTNVQNVLKEEMESHKSTTEQKPVFDTPDVSSSWSMILPAIFGNSGEDIKPIKPHISVTPDTVMLENSTYAPITATNTITEKIKHNTIGSLNITESIALTAVTEPIRNANNVTSEATDVPSIAVEIVTMGNIENTTLNDQNIINDKVEIFMVTEKEDLETTTLKVDAAEQLSESSSVVAIKVSTPNTISFFSAVNTLEDIENKTIPAVTTKKPFVEMSNTEISLEKHSTSNLIINNDSSFNIDNTVETTSTYKPLSTFFIIDDVKTTPTTSQQLTTGSLLQILTEKTPIIISNLSASSTENVDQATTSEKNDVTNTSFGDTITEDFKGTTELINTNDSIIKIDSTTIAELLNENSETAVVTEESTTVSNIPTIKVEATTVYNAINNSTEKNSTENIKSITTQTVEETTVMLNEIQTSTQSNIEEKFNFTNEIQNDSVTEYSELTTEYNNDIEQMGIAELLDQLLHSTTIKHEPDSQPRVPVNDKINIETTESTTLQPELKTTTTKDAITTSGENVIDNINQIISGAENVEEENFYNVEDSEKINNIVTNTSGKPMSMLQVEIATIASSLMDSDDNESTYNTNDIKDSINSQTKFEPVQISTELPNPTTTDNREKIIFTLSTERITQTEVPNNLDSTTVTPSYNIVETTTHFNELTEFSTTVVIENETKQPSENYLVEATTVNSATTNLPETTTQKLKPSKVPAKADLSLEVEDNQNVLKESTTVRNNSTEKSTTSHVDVTETSYISSSTLSHTTAAHLPSTENIKNPENVTERVIISSTTLPTSSNVQTEKIQTTTIPSNYTALSDAVTTEQINLSTLGVSEIKRNLTYRSTESPETTWALVSTVTPPKTPNVTNIIGKPSEIPATLNLVQEQLQGFGLEDTTTSLDADVRQFSELCNELAFRFWSSVTKGISSVRSLVVSPFAATSLLAMVFLGARGATSGEMNDILKLDDVVTFNPHAVFKNVTESIEVSKTSGVAISAVVRELYSDQNKGKLLGFYKARAKQFYDGLVEEANFKEIGDVIRRRTNLLVKRQTWGRIQEYVKDSSITVRPPLAAVSGSIFETDCSLASTDGRDGELHFVVSPTIRQRKLIPIPAAVWRSGFLAGYDPNLDATAVSIGTQKNIISTIFVIPGQQGIAAPGDGLAKLETRLTDTAFKQGSWSRLLRSLIPRPGLEVQIPRFMHKSIINATMALQRMGLKDLFDSEKADLRGLNGVARELHLSDMLQINTFATCGEEKIDNTHHSEIYPATAAKSYRRWRSFNENKSTSERDAVEEPRDYQRAFPDPLFDPSYLVLPLSLRPRQARVPEAPRLRFDRPFLFFVRHNPTGLILHMGRFNPRLLP